MKKFELSTPLMEHQKRAVNKLKGLRVGALFMDMGTGKSLTAMEIVRKRASKIDHVIWICPVSLKYSTAAEIKKHIGENVSIYVFDDKTQQGSIPDADWYIIGTESIGSSNRVYFSFRDLLTKNSCVIVDESIYIKSPTAVRTKRIVDSCRMVRYRYILTGTPMTQGLQDLYMQFSFLSPAILGYQSFYSFARKHLKYDKKRPDRIISSHNHGYIAKKINPYSYQVKKSECLDLPPKIYSQNRIPLIGKVNSNYIGVKEHYLEILENINDNTKYGQEMIANIIFALFTGLQKVLSGYVFEDGEWIGAEAPEPRVTALKDVLYGIDPNEKVIIWAKFIHDIDVISEMLTKEFGADSFVEFSGRKTVAEREKAIKEFKDYKRFFVATPASGGQGLTLNEASYVVYYNNSFKYSERLQSEDRCHRIGQNKSVNYIDIVTMNSIDDKIYDSLLDKKNVLDSFVKEVDKIKNDKTKVKELIKGL